MKVVSVVLLLLLAPLVTSCDELVLPLDCSDIYNHDHSRPSGVYTIYPIGSTSAVQVYCDMVSEGGKWTVFQRRMDGSVNFYRPWDHYKMGFGSAAGEYWLGLENLFHLTEKKKYELLVDMEDFSGKKVFARYSSFAIDSESNGYKLNVSGFTDGGAGEVYCDMVSEGGKWTVFQRRMDGSVNFYRPWDHYKMGFGSAAGEYWLGLENLFHLTEKKKYELLVDMEDFSGKKVFARYSSFAIDSESNGYKLNVSGFTDGGAGDSLNYHNGRKFSTFDKDQDSHSKNCARLFLGAFWYGVCHKTNPNGVYRWGADSTLYALGVEWSHWKGRDYSLKTISMKIRPVH